MLHEAYFIYCYLYVLHTSVLWYSIFTFIWRILHPVVVFSEPFGLIRGALIEAIFPFPSSPFTSFHAGLSWLDALEESWGW